MALQGEGRVRRVCAGLVAVVMLTGCSSSVGGDDAASTTGVSDAMLADAASFQSPGGLFTMPEASAAGVTTFLATAQYASVAAEVSSVIDWKTAAADPLPDSADLAQADAFLQVMAAGGVASLDPATLDQLSHAVVLPPSQSEVGAEIGALWTWSDAVSSLHDHGGPAVGTTAAAARLAAIDLAGVVGHPYLIARLAEVYTDLDIPLPTELTALLSPLSAMDPSQLMELSSLVGVLDTLAVVRARGGRGQSVDLGSGDLDRLAQLTVDDPDDDLLRSAVIEISAAAGGDGRISDLVAPLGPRVDVASGLLGGTTPTTGTIDATYLVARLVDLRFAEIASAATRDALAVAAGDAGQTVTTRLEAVAALKRAGDSRWEQYRDLATQAAAGQPRTVDQDALPGYLELMEPAVQVDPEITTASLTAFDPGTDEPAQRQAWAALRLAYLFSNHDEVASMFADLQKQMKGWADDPSTPFPQLLAAAAILPTSRVVSVGSSYLDALGTRIAGHRGCRNAATFFAVDGTPGGVCSVILTLQARGVPGGAA